MLYSTKTRTAWTRPWTATSPTGSSPTTSTYGDPSPTGPTITSGGDPLPSTPALVAKYLVHLDQERGLTRSSIQKARKTPSPQRTGAPATTIRPTAWTCNEPCAKSPRFQGMKGKQPVDLVTNDDMVADPSHRRNQTAHTASCGNCVESNKRAKMLVRIDIALVSLMRDIRIPQIRWRQTLTWADIQISGRTAPAASPVTKRRDSWNDKVLLLNISRETALGSPYHLCPYGTKPRGARLRHHHVPDESTDLGTQSRPAAWVAKT